MDVEVRWRQPPKKVVKICRQERAGRSICACAQRPLTRSSTFQHVYSPSIGKWQKGQWQLQGNSWWPVHFLTASVGFESQRHGLFSSALCKLKSGIHLLKQPCRTHQSGCIGFDSCLRCARNTGVAIRNLLMQIFNFLCRAGCLTLPVLCLCL